MKMTFQEIRIIATGPCITNQLRDVNTICRRSWYIAAHILSINNSRFAEFLPLYPTELEVKETTDTASSASSLEEYLEFDESVQLDKYVIDEELQHTYMTVPYVDKVNSVQTRGVSQPR
jgi:hypothetical protein